VQWQGIDNRRPNHALIYRPALTAALGECNNHPFHDVQLGQNEILEIKYEIVPKVLDILLPFKLDPNQSLHAANKKIVGRPISTNPSVGTRFVSVGLNKTRLYMHKLETNEIVGLPIIDLGEMLLLIARNPSICLFAFEQPCGWRGMHR
jgi:hypothetical protein